jgi:hypothetical protein
VSVPTDRCRAFVQRLIDASGEARLRILSQQMSEEDWNFKSAVDVAVECKRLGYLTISIDFIATVTEKGRELLRSNRRKCIMRNTQTIQSGKSYDETVFGSAGALHSRFSVNRRLVHRKSHAHLSWVRQNRCDGGTTRKSLTNCKQLRLTLALLPISEHRASSSSTAVIGIDFPGFSCLI